jgi:FtsP/CotA-like multicopper oxidase with cupredoxin domain
MPNVNEDIEERPGKLGFMHIFEAEAGKSYRFRFINAGSISPIAFTIEGHNMTLVEADGQYIKPYEVWLRR